MNSCVFRLVNLFGPCPCGREGSIYDRARKGWLCRDHGKERLCEFCQSERAWGRVWHLRDGIASESWFCLSCAGAESGAKPDTFGACFLPRCL